MKSPSDKYDGRSRIDYMMDYEHLDEDDRLTQEYYDRKLARGEEVLPYIALLAVVTFSGWVFWLVYKALEQLL